MKVTVLGGGGGVGASLAFNLLLREERYEVVLVDERPAMSTSHIMDLQQVVALGCPGSVRAGGAADLLDADVVVATAAVPLEINDSRMAYLRGNAAVLRRALAPLVRAGGSWHGVLLVVTNPVDPLYTCAQRWTGLPRERVVGYTLNDSLRLPTALGELLGVAPAEVDAWVMGEHGDLAVPLFDRVAVSGRRIEVGPRERDLADHFLRTWYARHVALDSGRSSTWTSGLGLARMIEAIRFGAPEPWPASVVLAGEYGVDGVALSVPVELGPGGVRAVHEWPLSAVESAALRQAASAVRRAAGSIAEPVQAA
jgi:malate dehydrogenase